jgi:predicted TIM-barrel fold metal-dependent hydrolase
VADCRRIDAHAHLLPQLYRRELERRSLTPSFGLPEWSPELIDGFMSRHQIDAAVVSLPPPGVYFGDRGLARELSRMVNEATSELVRSDPSRFAGLAVLPLPDVDHALDEIRHALDVLALDGVALLSNVGGTYLGDPAWDPVFAELDARGAYLFVHPTSPSRTPLDHPVWLYEFPFDTTRAVVQMIYTGTLERYPNLRVQLAHMGGTAPFLAHRIASLVAREPARADPAPAGALSYLRALYYDTGLSNNDVAVEAVLRIAPASHIVFGTDWPYADLPADGDPAPGLRVFGDVRPQVDGENVGALVARLTG